MHRKRLAMRNFMKTIDQEILQETKKTYHAKYGVLLKAMKGER